MSFTNTSEIDHPLWRRPRTHNPYFKRPANFSPYAAHRTPSPPRAFIEPLSPIIASRSTSNTWLSSNGHKKEESYGQLRTPLNGHAKFSRHRASSSIDALADAALAASSAFSADREKSVTYGTGYSPTMNGHAYLTNGRDYAVEPPHKRARSEYIAPSPMQVASSRPTTSYGHSNGRPATSACVPSETRFEDAALLLNFHTGGYNPPRLAPAPAKVSPLETELNHYAARIPAHTTSYNHAPSTTMQSSTTMPTFAYGPPVTQAYHNHYIATNLPPQIHHSKEETIPQPAMIVEKLQVRRTDLSPSISDSPTPATNGTTEDGQPVKKGRRGWPKGKPRISGVKKPAAEKVVKKKAPKKAAEPAKAKKPTKRQTKTKTKAGRNEEQTVQARRQSFNGTSTDWSDSKVAASRSRSVPREIAMVIHEPPPGKPGRRKSSKPETICSACQTSRETKSLNAELDDWISCNGCKLWFHIDCAGFKKALEVRDVDKYFCTTCQPKYGKTTYVRKSSRAHTAVDYAELQKGVLKMNEDNVEHHYIQPIKDGTFQFDPETFPRVRPELITREFFETSDLFTEPLCIPAEWNPRPWLEAKADSQSANDISDGPLVKGPLDHLLPEHFEYDLEIDDGQDRLGMVMPKNLTVRQVCNLVGADTPLDVIDVKSQNSGGARWNLGRWADYYEEDSDDKAIRNVISLEVSQSKLGRILKRPQIVRDIDLQDDVWPQEEIDRGKWPKVQFYCLMSVADSYTDFHIDFGGSSVYYHILKGKKTFFFIPPKPKYLKMYEDWNDSPQQNYTFLPNITKECYRVDLHEGDTMLIPSGWIHAVWTPATSLVIGGNFLTRLSYRNQFRVVEIEKNNETPMKFRYPFFQKIMWYTVLKYLKDDPLPEEVRDLFYAGQQFERKVPIWDDFNGDVAERDGRPGAADARYYPQAEMDGLPDLVNYIFRTVMVVMGRVEGATADRIRRVNASIPKGHGEPLEIAKTFALWVAWKRGNEDPPAWTHPEAVLPNSKEEGAPKKLSARALKEMERKEAIAAWRIAPDRQSARVMSRNAVTHDNPPQAMVLIKTDEVNLAAATFTDATNVKPDLHPSPSTLTTPELDTPPPVSRIVLEPDVEIKDESAMQIDFQTTPPNTFEEQSQIISSHHRRTSSNGQVSNMASVSYIPGQHISTPKTSVLGPKRVACDVCRKRRIRCKHKDLVQELSPQSSMAIDPLLDTSMTLDEAVGEQAGNALGSSQPSLDQLSSVESNDLAGFISHHNESTVNGKYAPQTIQSSYTKTTSPNGRVRYEVPTNGVSLNEKMTNGTYTNGIYTNGAYVSLS